MEMQYIKASNGKTYTVPADWDDERIYEHIKKQIKGHEANSMGNVEELVAQDANLIRNGKKPVNSQTATPKGEIALERFHDALRNLGAGAGESIYNAAQGIKPYLAMHNPKLLDANKMPNFQKAFGVREPNQVIQKIPESASYFIPGIGAEKALSKAPALARGLGTIAEQGVVQGGLASLFNPESRLESAGKAGGMGAGLQALINTATSRHPSLRALRYAIPRLGGAISGEEGARLMGLPPSMRTGGALLGLALGHAGSKLAPKILGRAPHAEGYAYDINEAIKHANPEEIKETINSAKRMGVHPGTPGQLTDDPILLANEKKAGVNKENIRLRHKYQEDIKANEERVNEAFKKGVYNEKEHKKLMDEAFDIAKPKKVPNNLLPNKHHDTYIRAIEFAKNNPELSAELSKSRPGSIGQYDVIRRALDKMLKTEPASKFNLRSARKDLSNVLKDFSDEYKTAMSYSEREKVAQDLSDLSKKNKLSGETFFQAIDDSKKLKNKILHTRDVEGAEQFLKDAHEVYKRRKSVDTTSLASNISEHGIPMSKSEAATFLRNAFNGKADNAMINMMYDPKTMSKVHKIIQGGDTEKFIIELAKALGKNKSQQLAREK
ncbi:hypothetical protein UFOVP270_28 [uncultured Caudovirales phage]|uniref:Uncharacterized protein n=1 Tax=uncultured Caudovirales phage TaxID=2100421 RepID=A0A6J5LJ48_9CAUD|nr:hypothetical protein UFOVP101_28 [uncultured Caudovirales phage]CAB4134195.1 hypothetical protein UFOVP270_28 [uncultured Caudovirales phage]